MFGGGDLLAVALNLASHRLLPGDLTFALLPGVLECALHCKKQLARSRLPLREAVFLYFEPLEFAHLLSKRFTLLFWQ